MQTPNHRQRQDSYRYRILKLQLQKRALCSLTPAFSPCFWDQLQLGLTPGWHDTQTFPPWQTPTLFQLQWQHLADHSQIYLSKPTFLLLSRPTLISFQMFLPTYFTACKPIIIKTNITLALAPKTVLLSSILLVSIGDRRITPLQFSQAAKVRIIVNISLGSLLSSRIWSITFTTYPHLLEKKKSMPCYSHGGITFFGPFNLDWLFCSHYMWLSKILTWLIHRHTHTISLQNIINS